MRNYFSLLHLLHFIVVAAHILRSFIHVSIFSPRTGGAVASREDVTASAVERPKICGTKTRAKPTAPFATSALSCGRRPIVAQRRRNQSPSSSGSGSGSGGGLGFGAGAGA